MEQSEIIRIAREAGFQTNIFRSELERFAALVAAHEREKRTQELMQRFLDPENQPTQFGTATLEYRESEIAAAYARGHDEGCKDFEALILPSAIASEREACAKVCEDLIAKGYQLEGELDLCAAAIRARNSHEKTN